MILEVRRDRLPHRTGINTRAPLPRQPAPEQPHRLRPAAEQGDRRPQRVRPRGRHPPGRLPEGADDVRDHRPGDGRRAGEPAGARASTAAATPCAPASSSFGFSLTRRAARRGLPAVHRAGRPQEGRDRRGDRRPSAAVPAVPAAGRRRSRSDPHGLARFSSLPGDGIGPEVTAEAVARSAPGGRRVRTRGARLLTGLIGGAAIEAAGAPLPPATRQAALDADAVLLGAVGAPEFDSLPPDRRPERGLLDLRQALGTFANLRPVPRLARAARRLPAQERRSSRAPTW